jgi:SPP1 gp7 family putative phage head morphogenesis protein
METDVDDKANVDQARQMFDFLFLGHETVNGRDPETLQRLFGVERARKGSKSPRSRKMKAIEEELKDYLDDSWNRNGQETLGDVLESIASGEGDLTQAEITEALDFIQSQMGAKFGAATGTAVAKILGGAYNFGRETFVSKPVFNLVDAKAKAFLADHDTFWIGEHYGDSVGPKIAQTVREMVIEQGLGRSEAAKALAEVFKDEFSGKSKNYWEVVAANATTRARNFGAVESFVQGKFDEIEIVAMMDEKTSPVCRYMNGKIFKTEWAVSQRDKMMAAKTPADVKLASRWVTYAEVVGRTPEQLYANGICLPPYHGRCRTITVVR